MRVEDINEHSVGSCQTLLVSCGVKHLFSSFTNIKKVFQMKTDGAV
jgi:hypothetical protein